MSGGRGSVPRMVSKPAGNAPRRVSLDSRYSPGFRWDRFIRAELEVLGHTLNDWNPHSLTQAEIRDRLLQQVAQAIAVLRKTP